MNKRACHVLSCQENESLDVITTIGQAFELRYNEYMQTQQQADEQREYWIFYFQRVFLFVIVLFA